MVTDCLVPKWTGDDLTVDRPLHRQPCLHRVLAICRHDQIVAMANNYGLLTVTVARKPEPGKPAHADMLPPEPVDAWHREIRALRTVTDLWDSGKVRELVAHRITERLARTPFRLAARLGGKGKIVLRYRPVLLIDAVWQQFGREAADTIRSAWCPHQKNAIACFCVAPAAAITTSARLLAARGCGGEHGRQLLFALDDVIFHRQSFYRVDIPQLAVGDFSSLEELRNFLRDQRPTSTVTIHEDIRAVPLAGIETQAPEPWHRFALCRRFVNEGRFTAIEANAATATACHTEPTVTRNLNPCGIEDCDRKSRPASNTACLEQIPHAVPYEWSTGSACPNEVFPLPSAHVLLGDKDWRRLPSPSGHPGRNVLRSDGKPRHRPIEPITQFKELHITL